MAIVKCSNDHYFDDNKFDHCPVCGDAVKLMSSSKKVVFSKELNYQGDEKVTERYDDNLAIDNELTVSKNRINSKNALTTGWLVCILGNNKGKSFSIKNGRNFVGRDFDMDIVIPDKDVSRLKHCSIVYDSKKQEFYFLHGNSPVMINDKFVKESIKLEENDVLTIGEARYIFIPYCKEGRHWDE